MLPPDRLIHALRQARRTARDLAFYVDRDVHPTVREEAALVYGILDTLIEAIWDGNRSALGAVSSGAKRGRKLLFDANSLPGSGRAVDHTIQLVRREITAKRPNQNGAVRRELATQIWNSLVRERVEGLFDLRDPLQLAATIDKVELVESARMDAIARSIPRRFAIRTLKGERIYVDPDTAHRETAPKRGQKPCACAACAASTIVRLAIKSADLPVDVPKRTRRPKGRTKK